MRKAVKVGLLLVLVLVVAGAGAVYYFTSVKKYDVADEEVDQIIESPYTIEYPEATPLPEGVQKDENGLVVVDKDGNFLLADGSTMTPDAWFASPEYNAAVAGGTAGGGGSAGSASDANDASDDGTTASNGGSGSSDGTSTGGSGSSNDSSSGDAGGGSADGGSTGDVTVDVIKSRYEGSFSSLQSQANGQLNSLIGKAKSEYVAKKEAGETVNPAYFYQKYSGAASNIEAKTDAAFTSLYSGLTSELKANGFSAAHAEEFKSQYEASKEARKNELMSQVAGR